MNLRRLPLLLVSCLLAASAACGDGESVTEIVFEVDTNLSVPAEMNQLALSVTSDTAGPFFNKTYALGTGANQIMLPRRMTLVPAGSPKSISVLASGLLDNVPVVSRHVVTSFLPGSSKLLRIDLLRSCVGVVCPPGTTCLAGGRCDNPAVDPSALPSFDPHAEPKPPFDTDAGIARDGGGEAGGLDGAAALDAPAGDASAPEAAPDVPATKLNGTLCAFAAECQSGFCSDGVCCASACTEPCHACNLAGQAGHCAPAWPGTDPRENCSKDDERTCKRTGACDGKGACQLYPPGTECFPQACSGFVRATASRCDGLGTCERGPILTCAPTLCDEQSSTGECLGACSGNGQCLAPATCQNGSCGKKPLGAACTQASDCNSGFCADGFCCQNACTDSCKSCAVPGSRGACIAVPSGTKDPKGLCAVDPSLPCGNDGTCDGTGRCKVATAGTPCADATCVGAMAVAPKFCDGTGACMASFQQSCEPYACAQATCKSACASNADCALGAYCQEGACIGKKGVGASCQAAADCNSGFCTDGVCCDGACDSPCSSCNQQGRAGTCSPLPIGAAPKPNGCPKEDAATCGKDGTCDGRGACRLYGEDTVCKAPSCSTATKTLASTCNSSGVCVAHGTRTCVPFQCGAADCLAACTSDGDCVPPATCKEGSCGKKPLGGICTSGTDCLSGFCSHGLCCDVACDSACQSCAVPGFDGTCKPVPAGLPDPAGTCTKAAAPDTCGLDGTCNGQGACRYYEGNVCGAASCAVDSLVQAGSCSGQGQCQTPPPQPCAPYLCETSAPACKTACVSDADCAASAYCNQGTCTARKDNGSACTLAKECTSNHCVDGFCCDGACTGTCLSCKVPGRLGTCTPVPLGNPSEGDCPNEGVSSCGRNGKCNGQGGCMFYPAGAVCVAETCPADTSTHTRPGLCDGAGRCNPGQVQSCAPYLCNGATNTCYGSCTSSAQCQPPIPCTNGSCGTKSNGQSCSSPGECTSNNCEQGVCCSSTCRDTCKSCAVDGSLGTCTFVRAGQSDPQGDCQNQGVATCGTNGLCDGIGGCQKYAAGLQCRTACDTGSATFNIYTCNGQGSCGLTTPKACSPYNCDSGGCKLSCKQPSDCAAGFVCSPSNTCVRAAEDCMNGIDDDGDNAVDCADPDCTAGYMCVPRVPSGWTGPAEVYEGASTVPPTCGGAYPEKLFSGYGAPKCDFSCSPCACGTPTGVTCGAPGLSYTTVPKTECPPATPYPPGECVLYKENQSMAAFQTFSPPATGGICPASGGTPSLSDITWNAGLVCTASGKGGSGCPAGYLCWPRPQSPFFAQACVLAGGDIACPTTGYTKKRNYYDSQEVKDTRECSATCGCSAPSGVSCAAKVTFWPRSGTGAPCSGREIGTFTVPTPCQETPLINIGSWMFDLGGYSGGTCPVTGTVTKTGGCYPMGDRVTTCCTP